MLKKQYIKQLSVKDIDMQCDFYVNPQIQNRYAQFQAETINFQQYGNNSPDVFVFSGNSFSIKQRAGELNHQFGQKNLKSMRINITGTAVKTFNLCCYITTIIIGSILIFPLFFICCDWWKRIVFQLYKIDNIGYQGLCEMIVRSGAEQFYVMIQDNYFNQENALQIQNALAKSRVRNFVFTNVASGFNIQRQNYSNFTRYMMPIKQLVYKSEIKWGNTILF